MGWETLNVRAAHQRQAEGWVYVDVRSPAEFADGHPEGAVNIPILFLSPSGSQPNPDFVSVLQRHYPPTTRLLLGCRSGSRSARACDLLTAAGYEHLANVAGGMLDWDAEGLPRSVDGKTWPVMQDAARS